LCCCCVVVDVVEVIIVFVFLLLFFIDRIKQKQVLLICQFKISILKMHKQAKYLLDTQKISTTLFWLCSVHVLSLPSKKEECDFC